MVDKVGVFIIKGKDRRVFKKDGCCFYYNDKFQRVHIDESQLENMELKKVEEKVEKKVEKKVGKRVGWVKKECVCRKCGKKSKSYYKDICIKCYRKDWNKKNPDKMQDYLEKRYLRYSKGGFHKSFALFGDICYKCKMRGRFRLYIRRYGGTGNLCMFIQVDHFDRRKEYSKVCYLGTLDKLQKQGKFLSVSREKYTKIVKRKYKEAKNGTCSL